MKHALKIVIPLFLVVALLAGAAWFFLSFRPDLTCAFFENRAEAALASGRSDRAVKWYTRAWSLYPEDPDIAIALADAYRQDDNYTKAEYTLVRAISQDPDGLDLYLALSRVYVEQDKLMDAEQMLSRTSNDAVKQQLDELRPQAPKIQPDSGSYDEYIDISLSYAGGDAYLSIDGDYPSTAKDLYASPVALDQGESTVMAIVVSEDGLVSPLATAGYVIGGIVEEVTFADPAVESTVRTVLDRADSESVMTSDLWALTTLELPAEVTQLGDLAPCRSLTSLSLHGTSGVDFSVLSQLTGLQVLDLSDSTVSSGGLAAIASLPALTELNLSTCALTNVSALADLTSLKKLNLSGNAITDISCLEYMTGLEEADLSFNTITVLPSLSALSNLKVLNLQGNQVVSLAPLSGVTSLTALNAANNQISDLTPLSGCMSLETLEISNNTVSDLSPVASIQALSILNADHNTIAALPEFSEDAVLSQLSVAYNSITDIAVLSGLPLLNYLNIDYNQVSDLSPLINCPTMVQVDAFADPVGDVSALEAQSIIVHYDPTASTAE